MTHSTTPFRLLRLTAGLLACGLLTSATTTADNPFISEYIDGTSFNRALEIYNPTEMDIVAADGAGVHDSDCSPTAIERSNWGRMKSAYR